MYILTSSLPRNNLLKKRSYQLQNMANFHLKIEIGLPSFRFLKENHYKLCLSKEVDNCHTVIWVGGEYVV